MRLINPTEKTVEFLCGGVPYTFRPGESRELPEYVALHGLERAHAPLEKHTPMHDKHVVFSDIVYSQLPWRKLVSMASARGIFRPGTARVDVEKALEEYDRKERGALQESSN